MHIAVVSAPSVFVHLKNLIADRDTLQLGPQITLLEFDKRFELFPEFIHYDFEKPLELDLSMKGRYDRVFCDPPFLSSACQTKAAMTVRWLAKSFGKGGESPATRVIVCTGERMEGLILRLYPGVDTTGFQPRHAQDRLSNDFRCYANYESPLWLGQ